MKYGLMVCSGTEDLGDDIQSYAAARRLPGVDHIIDREELDRFCPGDEPVAIIMNGGFPRYGFNWPPSPYIYPLLISMSLPRAPQTDAGFLDGPGGDYLRQYGPVGAMDDRTLGVLAKKDIPCGFSGCLTLTLPKLDGIAPNGRIILSDVSASVEEYVMANAHSPVEVIPHSVKYGVGDEWPGREKHVQSVLGKYQGAKCVITTRLQAALCCLALETPVLFICGYDCGDPGDPYMTFLHYSSESELISGDSGFDICDPPRNSPDYLPVRWELLSACEKFVSDCEAGRLDRMGEMPLSEDFRAFWLGKAGWQSGLMKRQYDQLTGELLRYRRLAEELQNDKTESEEETAALRIENERLTRLSEMSAIELPIRMRQIAGLTQHSAELEDELCRIKASKSYRLFTPYRKLKAWLRRLLNKIRGE